MTGEETKNLCISNALIACCNVEANWNRENVNEAIEAIVKMLKVVDDDLCIRRRRRPTHVHHDNIMVSFPRRGFANCMPYQGILMFGPRVSANPLTPDSFGYVREKPYIKKRCRNRIHCLIWLVLHEYCHLFKDRLTHKHDFYKLVDSKFEKYFNNF